MKRNIDKANQLGRTFELTKFERQLTFRGVVSRTRRVEARIDTQQLNVVGGRQLRITQDVLTYYSLPVETLDKFLFVAGYSRVGGGDVIPPF